MVSWTRVALVGRFEMRFRSRISFPTPPCFILSLIHLMVSSIVTMEHLRCSIPTRHKGSGYMARENRMIVGKFIVFCLFVYLGVGV